MTAKKATKAKKAKKEGKAVKNHRAVVTFVAFLAFLASLAAPSAQGAGVGTTAANFLSIGLGARPAAMGFAFAAVSDDLNAIQYNPAGLGLMKGHNVAFTYLSYIQDVNYGWMAYSLPLELASPGTLGISFGYLTLGGIEKRGLTDTETPSTTFGASDLLAAVTYSTGDMDGLALGATVKLVSESIDTVRATGFALDLGAFLTLKDIDPALTASVALQNLGTGLKFVNITDPFPTNLKAGLAYKLLDRTLLLAGDADYNVNDQNLSFRVGMEYWLQGMIAPRIGYGLAPADAGSLGGLGAGLGLRISDLELDYAYLPQGDLGNTHRVTLGYKF